MVETRKKLINAAAAGTFMMCCFPKNEVKKPQKGIFLCVEQIICERFIIISTKTENGCGWSEEEIIKNPFDIVQLTFQLFAPLTELMEFPYNFPPPIPKKSI
jgi:hypothetical protein